MANIWREPIFDRTYSDVTFALQQIELWKQSHSHSADVRLEEDRVILNPDGTSYVAEEAFVIKSNGVDKRSKNDWLYSRQENTKMFL